MKDFHMYKHACKNLGQGTHSKFSNDCFREERGLGKCTCYSVSVFWTCYNQKVLQGTVTWWFNVNFRTRLPGSHPLSGLSQLCAFRQVTQPLCASASTTTKLETKAFWYSLIEEL